MLGRQRRGPVVHDLANAGQQVLAGLRQRTADHDHRRVEQVHAGRQDGSDHPTGLPDLLQRWQKRDAEAGRARSEQSFLVPKAEIASNDYDLSISRYKQVVHAQVQYDPPQKILAELKALEAEIMQGVEELEGMLQ